MTAYDRPDADHVHVGLTDLKHHRHEEADNRSLCNRGSVRKDCVACEGEWCKVCTRTKRFRDAQPVQGQLTLEGL